MFFYFFFFFFSSRRRHTRLTCDWSSDVCSSDLDVRARQLFDSFPEAFLELHRDAEGERRQDGELVRGVDALDVEARIGFGVAAPLRFAEGGREIDAAVAHLGKNEVRRAVDDAGDPFDAVRGQAFAQR